MTTYRRSSSLTFACAMLLVMCGCGQLPDPPTGPSQPPSPTYTLSGVVTEATPAGALPVEGALVEEITRHRHAVTDKDGRYTMAGLAPGTVTIQVTVGELDPVIRFAMLNGDTVIDIQMAGPVRSTLSGFVTEDTAAGPVPVADVDVEVVHCPVGPPGGSYSLVVTTTDASGFYSIPGLCQGETALFPYKPGYRLAPTDDRPCEGDGAECRYLTIAGETRFDIRLVRR